MNASDLSLSPSNVVGCLPAKELVIQPCIAGPCPPGGPCSHPPPGSLPLGGLRGGLFPENPERAPAVLIARLAHVIIGT